MHNGRSALHALWSRSRPAIVWLPSYVCPELAEAVPREITVRYYAVGDALRPDENALRTQVCDGDHVLAVDYFGRPQSAEFVSLVRLLRVGWIQDAAHAMEAGEPSWGDWVLFSPRKLFGVPDGGILVSRGKSLPGLEAVPLEDFSFVLPSIERSEDHLESDNARWYASYVRAEAAMRVTDEAMSRLSIAILQSCNVEQDAETRRRNYRVLHARLARWAYLKEPDPNFAPLGFPIRAPSAALTVDGLARERIFAARHWKRLPSDAASFPREHQLASELVTLPCDYRYQESQMHRIAAAVIGVLGER